MFGATVQFNIDKKEEQLTIIGGVCSLIVRFALFLYLLYNLYKFYTGDYDNISTQYNFLDLDLVKPVAYKSLDFLAFYQIYKQDMNDSLAYPDVFSDDFSRYLEVGFT